ncbi:hypothetical protein BJ508DRAFT_414 [Ascobolus immersus RN42]|uniref:Uncharacterized protein n=1 Tax=Ascobolus immersus RN42 TaxID=1160509 RepID=A0A3N4J218_ASCIM|nr:hypothetical protein BJ508DRAFT_414 [Ascobolus immersus RN42]
MDHEELGAFISLQLTLLLSFSCYVLFLFLSFVWVDTSFFILLFMVTAFVSVRSFDTYDVFLGIAF